MPQEKRGWVDPDDAPELTKDYFERADLYHGDKLIRRGHPPSENLEMQMHKAIQEIRARAKQALHVPAPPVPTPALLTAKDFDSAVVGPSGGDDAIAVNNAFAAGAPSVRVIGSLNIYSPIIVPDYSLLYAESRLYITKQFDGPMCVLGSWAETYGINWEGNGGAYDGAGILCKENTVRQQLSQTRIMRCRGPCIDMSAYAAGAYSSIGGGELCLIQRYDITLPAIVLPSDEPGTTGVRRILACSGGGGKLVDLAGSNVTEMSFCDTYRLDMSPECRYAVLTHNRFAIPGGEVFKVRGTNHRFGFNTTSQAVHFTADAMGCEYEATNYDAGIVLEQNTQYHQIGYMPLVPAPIDNSGNDTNRVEVTQSI
jgi:hypothetical protein